MVLVNCIPRQGHNLCNYAKKQASFCSWPLCKYPLRGCDLLNSGSRVTLLQMGDQTPISQAIEMAVPILDNLEIPFIIVADSDDECETVTSVLEKSSVKERVGLI